MSDTKSTTTFSGCGCLTLILLIIVIVSCNRIGDLEKRLDNVEQKSIIPTEKTK